jgi:hypothetical protein
VKNLLVVVAVIMAIGISGAVGKYIVGAIQTQNAVNMISEAAESKTSDPVMPVAEARVEFMTGCDTGAYDRQDEYCGCMWEQLVQAYGVNTLINDGLNLNQQQIESKYDRHIQYCTASVYGNVEL